MTFLLQNIQIKGQYLYWDSKNALSQLAFGYSKLTIEILDQGVKHDQI